MRYYFHNQTAYEIKKNTIKLKMNPKTIVEEEELNMTKLDHLALNELYFHVSLTTPNLENNR